MRFPIDISLDINWTLSKGPQREQKSQKPLQQEVSANAGTGQHSAQGLGPYLSSKDGSLHHSEVLLVQHLVHVWEAPPARGEAGISE